jgi:hypothetical protein
MLLNLRWSVMPNGKVARLEEKVAEKMFKSLSYIKQSMGMGDIITLGWFPLKTDIPVSIRP